jgi:citrate synthase
MSSASHLSAREAAAVLGVSRATLYAYVSRGLVRSERREGSRERRYRAEDVWMLRRRREGRRDPGTVAEQSLYWGAPVLASRLTLIDDGRLYYRGHEAVTLATTSCFEDVAALLWEAPSLELPPVAPELPDGWPELRRRARRLPRLEALQLVLCASGAADAAGFDLSPEGVRRTGTRILRLLAAAAVDADPAPDPIAERLQRGWAPRRPGLRALLEAALVLLADHELNVSTFTARCVASAHATPYAVVVAALSALRGVRHGGAGERALALFEEAAAPARARETLEARLRRGERLPGFGHPLYPGADPRAALLLRLVREASPPPARLALVDALEAEAYALVERRANVDFALAAMTFALGLERGVPLALFGVARSAGWIAHALEQYAERPLIRPRARYQGPPPRA